jgi:hypothetical protein
MYSNLNFLLLVIQPYWLQDLNNKSIYTLKPRRRSILLQRQRALSECGFNPNYSFWTILCHRVRYCRSPQYFVYRPRPLTVTLDICIYVHIYIVIVVSLFMTASRSCYYAASFLPHLESCHFNPRFCFHLRSSCFFAAFS